MSNLNKPIIGCVETCSLEELSIQKMEIRIDTGAKTSSLHVDNIKKFEENGINLVRFDIHPNVHDVDEIITCQAKVIDMRSIKSSNGKAEMRYVIKTPISIGEHSWDIEITLTDRSGMNYMMLLGRQGLGERFLVDPASAFLL